MEALTTLIVVLTILFIIWWLNLDRPTRSLARSLNNLALAGEGKSVTILTDVMKDVELENLETTNAKLNALKALDL